jgi:hypothetical protein
VGFIIEAVPSLSELFGFWRALIKQNVVMRIAVSHRPYDIIGDMNRQQDDQEIEIINFIARNETCEQ